MSCNNDAACTAFIGLCPVVASPIVYAQAPVAVSSTVLPPVVGGAASVSAYPVYSSPILPPATTMLPPVTYPVYTAPIAPVYTAPATTSVTYPLYTAPMLPATYPVYTAPATTSVTYPVYTAPATSVSYPVYSSTTILPSASASLYARPSLAPAIATAPLSYSSTVYTPPVYTSPAPVYTAPAYTAPVYTAPAYTAPAYSASAYVSPVVPRAPLYRYGNGWRDSNGNLFDINGQPAYNFVRNNAIAGALEPLIPGIAGAVSVGNDVNFIRNAPQFLNGVVDGQGYNRNPLYAYARTDVYANQLGRFVPGLEGPLDALNKYNLYASILR